MSSPDKNMELIIINFLRIYKFNFTFEENHLLGIYLTKRTLKKEKIFIEKNALLKSHTLKNVVTAEPTVMVTKNARLNIEVGFSYMLNYIRGLYPSTLITLHHSQTFCRSPSLEQQNIHI